MIKQTALLNHFKFDLNIFIPQVWLCEYIRNYFLERDNFIAIIVLGIEMVVISYFCLLIKLLYQECSTHLKIDLINSL